MPYTLTQDELSQAISTALECARQGDLDSFVEVLRSMRYDLYDPKSLFCNVAR